MAEWFITSIVGLGIAVVGSGGVWLGAISSGRAAKKSGENALIDQLQEELNRYRTAADARATAQDQRMTRLDGLVDGYRQHAHRLHTHILEDKGPPPPPWPTNLPQ